RHRLDNLPVEGHADGLALLGSRGIASSTCLQPRDSAGYPANASSSRTGFALLYPRTDTRPEGNTEAMRLGEQLSTCARPRRQTSLLFSRSDRCRTGPAVRDPRSTPDTQGADP